MDNIEVVQHQSLPQVIHVDALQWLLLHPLKYHWQYVLAHSHTYDH